MTNMHWIVVANGSRAAFCRRDSTQYVPRVDPKRNEMEHFGRLLADELERLQGAQRLTRLTLVASNPFRGILRANCRRRCALQSTR
jgi:hypothetical protein